MIFLTEKRFEAIFLYRTFPVILIIFTDFEVGTIIWNQASEKDQNLCLTRSYECAIISMDVQMYIQNI